MWFVPKFPLFVYCKNHYFFTKLPQIFPKTKLAWLLSCVSHSHCVSESAHKHFTPEPPTTRFRRCLASKNTEHAHLNSTLRNFLRPRLMRPVRAIPWAMWCVPKIARRTYQCHTLSQRERLAVWLPKYRLANHHKCARKFLRNSEV